MAGLFFAVYSVIMDRLLNSVSSSVRSAMMQPAKLLDSISNGRIRPNHITLVSLLGHGSVVWALWAWRPILAAVLLAFFGLMDSLDGALARLKKTSSVTGMLYDAVSDRIKEVLVYVGLTYWVSYYANKPQAFAMIVAVCGLSLTVSYIKAKGEMALGGKHDAQALNRIFASGIARYEVRMALIIIGLVTGTIRIILPVLIALLLFTCLQRMVRVSKALAHVQG